MKALIATDLHLRPAHIELARKVLQLIEDTIDLKKPEYLIILGDTFHTKNQVYASMLNLYQDFIERITKKVKVIQLIGNHDWAIQYSDHPFKSFKYIENLTIVDDYYVLGDNAFISYARETERFQDMLTKAGPNITRIFSHMDMNGFTPGSGWEEISPYFDAEYFTKYKQVISGHLHLAQNKVLNNGTEIIFVGSAYTTDFGESDQEKRFLFIDLETGKWESIPTNMTYHKTFKINAGDPFPEISADEVKRGVEYRVIVKGTKEQIYSLILPKKYLARIAYDITAHAGTRIELSASDTQEDTMKKFTTAELNRSYGGLEKSGLDMDRLIKTGKRFLPNG